jgi:tuftelin-interacting protein 11
MSSSDEENQRQIDDSDEELQKNVSFVKGGDRMDVDSVSEEYSSDSTEPERRIPRNREEEEEEEEERPNFGQNKFGLGLKEEVVKQEIPTVPPKSFASERPMLGQPTEFKSTKGKKKFVPQQPVVLDKDFAAFEKYTKGIGSKLLMKMGYKLGQGLGADGKGIATPIDVKLRPAKMGLGHGGFDERTKKVKEEQKEKVIDSEMDADRPVRLDRWKKVGMRKRRPLYKTAREILQDQASQAAPVDAAPIATTIRDLTGKEERVLTDLSQLSTSMIGKDGRLPELRFNVQMIIGLCQNDVVNTGKQILLEKAHQEQRLKEKQELQDVLVIDSAKLDRLKKVMSIVVECKALYADRSKELLESKDPSLIMSAFRDYFQLLGSDYRKEVFENRIDAFVMALLTPLLRAAMSDWDPLRNPRFAIEELEELANVFVEVEGTTVMTAFESMIYLVWYPRVRQAIKYF